MRPCILSLEGPILLAVKTGNKLRIAPSPERKVLSAEESKELIGGLILAGTTDCGTIKSMSDGIDYWGNPIKITISELPDASHRISVLSLGPDGKESTEDDMGFEVSSK